MNQTNRDRYWVMAEFTAFRLSKNMSRNKAAKLLGVNYETLRRLERQEEKLTPRIVERMSFLILVDRRRT